MAATAVIVPVRSEGRGADGLVDLLEVLDLLNPSAYRACPNPSDATTRLEDHGECPAGGRVTGRRRDSEPL